MSTTAEIMDTGINYLIEKLGTVETGRFISVIIRECSDYTKWRQKYCSNITSEDFNEAAVKYIKENPFS